MAWFPPGLFPCEPVMAPTQPWIPLNNWIDEMITSTPDAAPPDSGLLHPSVVKSEDVRAILTRGLFPHDCLCQSVWVKDDGSPTKYGQQQLLCSKLAMLWDVPILSMALFGKSSEDMAILEKLLDSPLAKFLELGTDQLFTGYSRGGGSLQRFSREGKTRTK